MTNSSPGTEIVTVNDLTAGDTITELGNVTFPFPFELTAVRKTKYGNATMNARHGWFTMRAVSLTDRAVRVVA